MVRRFSLCAAIVMTACAGTGYLCVDSGKTRLYRPGDSGLGMAFVALLFGGYVSWWFSTGDHVVMATGAKSKGLAVIYPKNWCPCRAAMTILTEIAGIDMELVFARSIDTVVAALAIVCDVFMFEFGWRPGGTNIVALFAIIVCRHVFVDLAPGGLAVVAAYAVVRDAGVIHAGGDGKI